MIKARRQRLHAPHCGPERPARRAGRDAGPGPARAGRIGRVTVPGRRSGLFSAAVLAVVTAVLAVLLPPGTASAAAGRAAGTRVGASATSAPAAVGASRLVPAVQGRGQALPCPVYAPGACVAAEAVPTLEIDAARMPSIARNVQSALDEGHPGILNRTTNDALIRSNRSAACQGFCGPGSPDEYPFASTLQGGAGARVAGVPLAEQRIQGGVLSRFYQKYGIGDGDPFRVVVTGLEP
jgi:hypothetical protein